MIINRVWKSRSICITKLIILNSNSIKIIKAKIDVYTLKNILENLF